MDADLVEKIALMKQKYPKSSSAASKILNERRRRPEPTRPSTDRVVDKPPSSSSFTQRLQEARYKQNLAPTNQASLAISFNALQGNAALEAGALPPGNIAEKAGIRLKTMQEIEAELGFHIKIDAVIDNFIPIAKLALPVHRYAAQIANYTTIGVVSASLRSRCATCIVLRLFDLKSSFIHIIFKDAEIKPILDTYRVGSVLMILNPDLVTDTDAFIQTTAKTMLLGKTTNIAKCKIELCSTTINCAKTDYCEEHSKHNIELYRRKRQFLSNSHVIIGDPPLRAKKRHLVDLNASYVVSEYVITICGNTLSISVYGKKNGAGSIFYNAAKRIEDKEDSALVSYLAGINDAGGRQIRALHGINLAKSDTSKAFSVDALRKLGFNPVTREDYIFRNEDGASRKRPAVAALEEELMIDLSDDGEQ